MSKLFALSFFGLCVLPGVTLSKEPRVQELSKIAFHDATEADKERHVELGGDVDVTENSIDRYAFIATGYMEYGDKLTELWVIHAEDREKRLIRHTCTKASMPLERVRVQESLLNRDYSATKNNLTNPITSSWMANEEFVFFQGHLEGFPKAKTPVPSSDYNFNPFSAPFLYATTYQHPPAARRPTAGMFSGHLPSSAATIGDRFYSVTEREVKYKGKSLNPKESRKTYYAWVDGICEQVEHWEVIGGDETRMHSRNTSKWREVKKLKFPVSAKSIVNGRGYTRSFQLEFDWLFGDSIPQDWFDENAVMAGVEIEWPGKEK